MQRIPAVVMACLIGILFGAEALAQRDQLKPQSELDTFTFKKIEFQKLVRGDKEPTTKEDEDLIRLAAEYYVYTNSYPPYQKTPKRLDALRRVDFESSVIVRAMNASYTPKNGKFRELFVRELIKCFRKVFDLEVAPNRSTIVNAGLMLPIVAKLHDDNAADYFAELATIRFEKKEVPLGKDKKQKKTVVTRKSYPLVVQYFGLKALAVHFAESPPRIGPFDSNEARKRHVKRIEPLITFIESPPEDLQLLSKPELDAYRFVRLQAIRALANTRLAWIPYIAKLGEKKKPEPHAPVAVALLRVLSEGKDRLTPQPTVAEKVEAIKGLCRIDANRGLVENQPTYYNPGPALKQICRGLIAVTEAYIADREVFTIKDSKIPPILPWRRTGEELREAVAELIKNLPTNSKYRKWAEALKRETDPIFNQTKNLAQVEAPAGLETLLTEIIDIDPIVFRGYKQFRVDLSGL